MNIKKVSLSTLFVLMLMVPTILGAVPLTIQTPVGTVSTDVCEAEARNRNTNANRPRSLTARNTGAQRVQSFSASRTTYTINVRQSTSRADIRVGLRAGQQVRWRIDTRRANDTWNNGSYNSWRSRTTRNTHRDVRVNINQGQQRRLRFQIRDNSGNIRTLNINVRRASGNTWASSIRPSTGSLSPAFHRSTTSYTLNLPTNRFMVDVTFERAHHNAQLRGRFRDQNEDGTWGPWTRWSSFRRADAIATLMPLTQFHDEQVQVQIRGAFTNMPNTPTRTRNYSVRVTQSPYTWNQAMAMDIARDLHAWGFTRQQIINELLWWGFTQAEATFAVDRLGITFSAPLAAFAMTAEVSELDIDQAREKIEEMMQEATDQLAADRLSREEARLESR